MKTCANGLKVFPSIPVNVMIGINTIKIIITPNVADL